MSEIMEKAARGIPLSDELVIDAHCHMGLWQNFNLFKGDAEGMVSRMDRLGVRCCVAAHHAAIGPDFVYGNSEVLDAMERFPGRIYGYCTINPNYPEKELYAEMERCISKGMVGLKIHPCMHDYPVDGDRYIPVWDFANRNALPVLSHTEVGGNNPVKSFEKLAETYPNAVILLGHSGFGSKGADLTIEAVSNYPNIYAEVAASVSVYGTLERMVSAIGADRVVFGTDLPFLDPRAQFGHVTFAKLDDTEKRLILGGNAKRIFGIGE